MKKRLSIFLFKNLFYLIAFKICLFPKISMADPFQYDYRSARYLGRGDTGIANTNGTDAMFYNPAVIAGGTNRFSELILVSPEVEASNNIKDAYDKKDEGDKELLNYVLENKNKPFYASAQNLTATVFRKFALGILARGDGYALVKEDAYTGLPVASLGINSRVGGYVSMAHDMLDGHFLVGLTAKFREKRQYNVSYTALEIDAQLQNNTLTQSIKNSERRGQGMGVDVGALLILDKESETQIGLVGRNLGMEYSWSVPQNSKSPDKDITQLDVGFSTSFGTKRGRVKLLADYRDILDQQNKNYTLHTHLGMEYNIENVLIVMTGLNQGYVTYGIAFNLKIIRFEGGSYTEEMGDRPGQIPSVRYFGRVSIGWTL